MKLLTGTYYKRKHNDSVFVILGKLSKMIDLKSVCQSVIPVVKEVSEYIRSERLNFKDEAVKNKSTKDLVSYVDQTAERMLVERLSKILPEAGFITEEKTIDNIKELNWIIDPLDGTTNYISGYPVYSSTVGLALNNEALLGVTVDIPFNKCYYAWKGGGASCDNKRIYAKKNADFKKSLIVIGTPYYMEEEATPFFALIRHLYENSLGVRISGSAVLDMVQVATGNADAYVQFGLFPWDITAGYILIKEAGGMVTTFDGIENIHNGEIVAAGAIHPELIKTVNKFMKVRG